jgi:hypothetical protein
MVILDFGLDHNGKQFIIMSHVKIVGILIYQEKPKDFVVNLVQILLQ